MQHVYPILKDSVPMLKLVCDALETSVHESIIAGRPTVFSDLEIEPSRTQTTMLDQIRLAISNATSPATRPANSSQRIRQQGFTRSI
jgi:hypothetical protein